MEDLQNRIQEKREVVHKQMPTTTKPEHRSLATLFVVWLILQFGGIFSPGLLDDVDSVYLEVAREMLHRHDYVTPYIDGIRFFDKPPLMYWLAAGSMRLFGEHDWAGRLPLAFAFLGLLLAVYALGKRLYSERGGFYAALILATSIGPYLYTRFYIPDIVICLWMTLGVHAFLIALDRAAMIERAPNPDDVAFMQRVYGRFGLSLGLRRAALFPAVGFGIALALNLLTKGLIGLVFPLGFVVFYLLFTRQFRLLKRMSLLPALAAFLAVALPWHVLAALRIPAIAMPAGLGLPAHAGWSWFYLYNEHVARFLGKRIPHDYGNTPRWLFLLYAVIWMMPWAIFLPAAIARVYRHLGHRYAVTIREREAALTTALWAGIVLVFFCLSSRQEYYSLPALPALALMLSGLLAGQDSPRAAVWCHRWLLLPLASLVAVVCAFFAITAPKPAPGTDLAALLSQNPELYNLSLGHLFDLTGAAMGLFRGPLVLVAVGMVVLGLASYVLRRSGRGDGANLTLAGGMVVVLLATHEGLVRFNPILGSKPLADAVLAAGVSGEDVVVLDGELTSGSTLLFYTRQPVHLVNGRVNGPWFGSFWPDAPKVFEDEASLRVLWAGPKRVFLMTYVPASRVHELSAFGMVRTLASAGGKTVLVNR